MRKRFNKDEKALIASGAPVEVRTGRYWHPAVISSPEIHRPFGNIEHVVTTVTSGKYQGQVWHTIPSALRAVPALTTTTVTLGFTESDRADGYCSYDDGYRLGAAQNVVTITVTGPTSTLTLDEWAEAMFCASNAPAYPGEHPVVEAARAALADAQWDGARLRSLSIGDTVTVGGRTVACDKGAGWKPVFLPA